MNHFCFKLKNIKTQLLNQAFKKRSEMKVHSGASDISSKMSLNPSLYHPLDKNLSLSSNLICQHDGTQSLAVNQPVINRHQENLLAPALSGRGVLWIHSRETLTFSLHKNQFILVILT